MTEWEEENKSRWIDLRQNDWKHHLLSPQVKGCLDEIDRPMSSVGPYPRYWGDAAIPSKFFRDGGVGYEEYLDWLADYLFDHEFRVPECQKSMVDRIENVPTAISAFTDIGEELGYSQTDIEDCEDALMRGLGPIEFRKEELERYERGLASGEIVQVEDYENFGISQDAATRQFHILPLRLTNRLMNEAKQRKAAGCEELGLLVDIPYRAVLAHALKYFDRSHGMRTYLLGLFFAATKGYFYDR